MQQPGRHSVTQDDTKYSKYGLMKGLCAEQRVTLTFDRPAAAWQAGRAEQYVTLTSE